MPMVIASLTTRPAVEVSGTIVRPAVIPDPEVKARVNATTKIQPAVEGTAQLKIS